MRSGQDHRGCCIQQAGEGASPRGERVRELMGYREPGVVPTGTFKGPRTDSRVSLGKMGVLLADRLDSWGPQTYIHSHMCMEEQWPGSNKENRVLFPKRKQEWKLESFSTASNPAHTSHEH